METPLLNTRQSVAEHWIRPLREGKPELGWSGDPFLVLAFHQIENRWELWRNEPERGNPDRHVMIAKGPIGQDINQTAIDILIRKLVEMDTHRAGNSAEAQMERILRENEEHDRKRTQEAADAIADPLAKFYYEAGKTMGVTETNFYFPGS